MIVIEKYHEILLVNYSGSNYKTAEMLKYAYLSLFFLVYTASEDNAVFLTNGMNFESVIEESVTLR